MPRSPLDEREIVYVWPYLEWGGIQTYFLALMKHAGARHRVRVVCPAGTSDTLRNFLDAADVPCSFIDAHQTTMPANGLAARLSGRWQIWHVQFALARVFNRRALQHSVIHCDLPPWTYFPLLAYLSARGRVMFTLHTALPQVGGFRRWSWRLKFGALSRLRGFHLLATNDDARASLRRVLSPRAYAHVTLAPSGVDPEEIAAAEIPTRATDARFDRLGLPRNRFYVVTAAQFIARKGCWVLLDAARRLCARDPDIAFLWLSTLPLDEADRARVETYGLGDRFRCLTAADFGATRVDLLSLVHEADVFVMPSFEEGLPLAIVEAMGLGMPIVASRINGIPEVIDHDVHGVLVPPGDPAVLAEALMRLMRDSALRARLSAAARARAFESLTWDVTVRPTLALYRSA